MIVDGEDLSPFRDVSKRLYALLRAYSWSGKIERLGLDEIFLDVTDMIAFNIELLNRNSLASSFFCLSRSDPERGFGFDASSFSGCVHGDASAADTAQGGQLAHALFMRLLLASHLAAYLRLKIEDEGYTTSCGISTSKPLAKLVGNKNKPRNQTTLLALTEEDVLAFMDEHSLRKVPGIGAKITATLEAFVLGKEVETDLYSMESSVTVGQVRTHPSLQLPSVLDGLLGGRGSERGLAGKVWSLLHGVDDTEVKPARDVPTQISIEDTYKGLNEASEIRREMLLITASLLRRMHADLLEDDIAQTQTLAASPRRWLACPKTVRLTTRPYTSPSEGKPYNWARTSRSTALPGFVFSHTMASEQIVEKLVAEILLPLFYKINTAPRGWNTGLLNVCVTNMAGPASDGGSVRDISTMFRRQDEVLREFTVYDTTRLGPADLMEGVHETKTGSETVTIVETAEKSGEEESCIEAVEWEVEKKETSFDSDDDGWEEQPGHGSSQEADTERCALCRHLMPRFALAAHRRFHLMAMDDDEQEVTS